VQLQEPYKVVAICQRPEEQEAARAAGAYLVSDLEFVQQLQAGDVPNDFDYCITTPDLLSQLVPIRGILNRRFPTKAKGTVGFEVGKMIDKLANSIEYRVQEYKPEPSFASLETPVGKLTMPPEQIEANIRALVEEVCLHKPLSMGPPIIRFMFLKCLPTKEKFMIPHDNYVPTQQQDKHVDLDDDEESAVNK